MHPGRPVRQNIRTLGSSECRIRTVHSLVRRRVGSKRSIPQNCSNTQARTGCHCSCMAHQLLDYDPMSAPRKTWLPQTPVKELLRTLRVPFQEYPGLRRGHSCSRLSPLPLLRRSQLERSICLVRPSNWNGCARKLSKPTPKRDQLSGSFFFRVLLGGYTRRWHSRTWR